MMAAAGFRESDHVRRPVVVRSGHQPVSSPAREKPIRFASSGSDTHTQARADLVSPIHAREPSQAFWIAGTGVTGSLIPVASSHPDLSVACCVPLADHARIPRARGGY